MKKTQMTNPYKLLGFMSVSLKNLTHNNLVYYNILQFLIKGKKQFSDKSSNSLKIFYKWKMNFYTTKLIIIHLFVFANISVDCIFHFFSFFYDMEEKIRFVCLWIFHFFVFLFIITVFYERKRNLKVFSSWFCGDSVKDKSTGMVYL